MGFEVGTSTRPAWPWAPDDIIRETDLHVFRFNNYDVSNIMRALRALGKGPECQLTQRANGQMGRDYRWGDILRVLAEHCPDGQLRRGGEGTYLSATVEHIELPKPTDRKPVQRVKAGRNIL